MGWNLSRAVAEHKALAAHPALMGSEPVTIVSQGASRKKAQISQRSASRHLDAYGGAQAIDHVYDCVGLYADPAGTAPWHLEKDDGTRLIDTQRAGTPPDHQEGPADLYRLLKAPNPYMLYDEMMALLIIDLFLVGNAYWFKWQVTDDKPLALYRLAPAHVKIIPGAFGPLEYEYQPPGARKPMKITDPTQLIHFRRPNPNDAYYGMGVIQGAGRSMDLELAITDTIASYYENRADPSLIVQSDRRVPREVFNKLRAQLRSRVSGSKRAGELLVLEAGLKASSLSTSASDALFDKLSTMSRDRIYTKFRASPRLFGMEGSSGGDKVSDARREFDNYALRPLLTRLGTQISAALTQAWGVNYVIDHRTLLPPEEAVKVAGQIASTPGMKVREVRKQYAQFGIEESTGDKEIDETILNMPTPEIGPNGEIIDPQTGLPMPNRGADRNLPGEPGRPPKGSNTRPIRIGSGKAMTERKTLLDIQAELAVLSAAEAGHKALLQDDPRGTRIPGEQRPGDPFAAARRVDIDATRNEIAAGLREAAHGLERDLLDTVEGKALKTSDIVKRMRESAAWATFKERIQRVLEDGAKNAAASGVMHTGRTPEDEIDYDALAASVVHRPDGLRSILKTIREKVVARIKEVRSNDGERSDFEAAVRAAVSEWADGRALVIADTEATHAYNEATLTALEMTGETTVFVEDGEDHDEPCQAANGQVWEIDHARQHRLEHPNCRRAFLSVAEVS